eukprot:9836699-Alexandrium_andersonii.AAC.1
MEATAQDMRHKPRGCKDSLLLDRRRQSIKATLMRAPGNKMSVASPSGLSAAFLTASAKAGFQWTTL